MKHELESLGVQKTKTASCREFADSLVRAVRAVRFHSHRVRVEFVLERVFSCPVAHAES